MDPMTGVLFNLVMSQITEAGRGILLNLDKTLRTHRRPVRKSVFRQSGIDHKNPMRITLRHQLQALVAVDICLRPLLDSTTGIPRFEDTSLALTCQILRSEDTVKFRPHWTVRGARRC